MDEIESAHSTNEVEIVDYDSLRKRLIDYFLGNSHKKVIDHIDEAKMKSAIKSDVEWAISELYHAEWEDNFGPEEFGITLGDDTSEWDDDQR